MRPKGGEGVGFARPKGGEGVGFVRPKGGEGVGFARPKGGEGVGFVRPKGGEGVGFVRHLFHLAPARAFDYLSQTVSNRFGERPAPSLLRLVLTLGRKDLLF
ncbi:MAG: hypothetical protein KatS3mg110_1455 [Pirellulaceae bacterium]|nr:MAG: hypothetical protein KatS3mg110_1455 [Pirellulaceae bacterium]